VFMVSATSVLKRPKKFMKMGSRYCKRKTKEKLVLYENSVSLILLRAQYVLC
jgi:hypothetical protein